MMMIECLQRSREKSKEKTRVRSRVQSPVSRVIQDEPLGFDGGGGGKQVPSTAEDSWLQPRSASGGGTLEYPVPMIDFDEHAVPQ